MNARVQLVERRLRTLQRLLWMGVIVNLAFAVPAISTPNFLAAMLGLPASQDSIWLQNVGMLLVAMSIMLIPVALASLPQRAMLLAAVSSRTVAAIFWLVMSLRYVGLSGLYIMLGVDGLLAVIMILCLFRLSAAESYSITRRRAPGLFSTLLERGLEIVFRVINRFVVWHKLPLILSLPNLSTIRDQLRTHNLHDTALIPNPPSSRLEGVSFQPHRSADGSYTDPASPAMGASETRFGRNMPLDKIWPDKTALMSPSPREISRRLMTRDKFIPANTLNLLAAAWIQFMNHDWFNHRRPEQEAQLPVHEIPIRGADDWAVRMELDKPVMQVRHTPPDPTRKPGAAGPATFLNTETHWWDASQIYGSNRARQRQLRTFIGGRMTMGPDNLLPLDPASSFQGGIDLTGFNDNWWMGLSMLHTLFTREHNYLCDELAARYPEHATDDEWLFQKARLINAALMAKIHTVEWTPGILGHPALQIAMNANWYGLLWSIGIKVFGIDRMRNSEILFGIPGSETDHHAAQYALTEEFVSVYRMHPLIPDEIEIRQFETDQQLKTYTFDQVQGVRTRQAVTSATMEDHFYSFGIAHPGAITLHNFPRALQHFTRTNGDKLDLAAIDILRDRERGVMRYNDFREHLRMPRVKTFAELTENAAWAKELEEVYEGDMDKVDLLVGMLAESPPKGFGFSDTAFRIFIVMASRRLKSDRFFTTDYRPEVYTQFGIDHVESNLMKDVILRHHPKLAPCFTGVKNAFAPWKRGAR